MLVLVSVLGWFLVLISILNFFQNLEWMVYNWIENQKKNQPKIESGQH
jgi:hypothetical protein